MKHLKKFLIAAAIMFSVNSVAICAYAQSQPTEQAAVETHQARGVVTQVNAQRGLIVVHHEPIESLGWEEMTMPLPVTDKALLEPIEVGDHVVLELIMPEEVATIRSITVIENP